jgi:6-phosphogluconolactonase
MAQNPTLTYILSSQSNHELGVYICELDLDSGVLRQIDTVTAVAPCHYLAIHPQRRFLYVTGTNGGEIEESPGMVSAFSLDARTGAIQLLNQQPTNGPSPCYVTVDGAGQHVLVVNYNGDGGGSVCVFPIREDGSVGEMSDYVRHSGASVHPERQTESHPHMVITDPASGLVFVTDLGTDRIYLYHINASGKLIPHDPPFAEVTPGTGPRHLAFADQTAYLVGELSNTLTVFDYDPERGTLRERQTLSLLPDDFQGGNDAADIHVLPSGRFVYASNRGHNSIAIFAADPPSGKAEIAGFESVQGNWPRSFTLDPSGRVLIVANQRSHNVVTFWIDQETGALKPTGHSFEAPAPICVKTLTLTR